MVDTRKEGMVTLKYNKDNNLSFRINVSVVEFCFNDMNFLRLKLIKLIK